MRTRTILSLAALAVYAATAFSQTPSPSQAPQSMPAPTEAPASSIPSRPAPSTQQQPPAATPPAPQPAPATTPATQQAPPAQPAPATAPATQPPPAAQPTPTAQVPARPAYAPAGEAAPSDDLGSVFIPVDSWVYPAMTRLYSMGYLDTMFLGMRPWTRQSALHMLLQSKDKVVSSDDEQAQELLAKLLDELSTEIPAPGTERGAVYGLQSAYTRVMGISGTTLRDSYHLGQTIANDYGRPYQPGFNNVTGFSTANEWGRFSLYLRGEYQHAPSAPGYSLPLAQQMSAYDLITPFAPPNKPQDTIPAGPIAAQNPFHIVEGTLSFHLLGHEISGGKSDAWLGPAQGGAMAWSNNAENIYSFRVDRVEPLHIPLLSDLLGPVRYDFFYGSLKGHTAPNHPWVHSEMFSFRPTRDFEFGFQRTIIFGGAGHAPVTLHSFLHGFFNLSDTTPEVKYSRTDPGARFSDFNFSYRLPFVRRYATLYVDAISHDDVTPISAPRRASYRTGLYISQFPGLPRLSLRTEAVTTDPGVRRSNAGTFNYFEIIQVQGYTNKGFIMGDWIGREAKGGQAWLTYQLSGNESVQLEYLNKKTPKDFIAGGTTQNQFKISLIKRIKPDVELNTWYQYEGWKAPIYKPGLQKNSIFAVQLTWFPKLNTYLPAK